MTLKVTSHDHPTMSLLPLCFPKERSSLEDSRGLHAVLALAEQGCPHLSLWEAAQQSLDLNPGLPGAYILHY